MIFHLRLREPANMAESHRTLAIKDEQLQELKESSGAEDCEVETKSFIEENFLGWAGMMQDHLKFF